MFNIKLVDIGGDGLVTQFHVKNGTLAETEIIVEGLINQRLGVHSTRLEHVDELVYNVWLNGHEIGVVVIRDVNEYTVIRK